MDTPDDARSSPDATAGVEAAVVWCEKAFGKPAGRLARALSHRSERFRVTAVIDSSLAGRVTSELIDQPGRGVPIVSSLKDALRLAGESRRSLTHFIVGLTSATGRLPAEGRVAVTEAIRAGLNVVSCLRESLSADLELGFLAERHGATITDPLRPSAPPWPRAHTGKIAAVGSFRLAVVETDAATGKTATCWALLDALHAAGHTAELVGTGLITWLQGVRYGALLAPLATDMIAGEVEDAVWNAWTSAAPDVIVIEGGAGPMNPAHPGGLGILAGARANAIVLQHAPGREVYLDHPSVRVHPLDQQIRALELVSSLPVVAVALSRENLSGDEVVAACAQIERTMALPAFDVRRAGAGGLVEILRERALLGRTPDLTS